MRVAEVMYEIPKSSALTTIRRKDSVMDQFPRQAIPRLSRDSSLPGLLCERWSLRGALFSAGLVAACVTGLSWLARDSFSAPTRQRLADVAPRARLVLSSLQARLGDADISVRLDAAEACLRIDPYHVPALRELLAALDDDNPDTRRFAINALGNAAIDNPQAQFALQWALTDKDKNVAIAASFNLSQRFDLVETAFSDEPSLSPKEITQLIAKLSDRPATARKTAAIKLGMCGPAAWKAGTALRKCLSDADPTVRLQAAHALWRIDQQATAIVPKLIEMQGTNSPAIRVGAVSVLGEIGPAASVALPALSRMLAGSEPGERLHLAFMISRIDSNNRQMLGIVTAGLSQPGSEMRYLAALALGSNPAGQERGDDRAPLTEAAFRNLRIEAAAEELHRVHVRIADNRRVPAASPDSNTSEPLEDAATGAGASPFEDLPNDLAQDPDLPQYPDAEDLRVPSHGRPLVVLDRPVPPADSEELVDRVPIIAKVAQSNGRRNALEIDEEVNPEEGLKPIRDVRASIRIMDSDPTPPDYARAKMAAAGPPQFQGLGYTRGFPAIGFGWDAPAVCFRPLYFEDINLERYGINYGCCEILVSTGIFTKNVILLPYKILVQPGCENIYTLGYERPNNCIPLHCYCTPCPDFSLRRWRERQHFRPYRAADVWDAPDGVCDSDCREE
jgi:HEAT repeat protein